LLAILLEENQSKIVFSFPKIFKIHPKAVRTRSYKGSLIGQVIFKNNLTFFYIWSEFILSIMKKIFYIFLLITPLLFVASCDEEIEGCMDDLSCNYNPEANIDNGSCYNNDIGCGCDNPGPELGYDCEGNFIEYVIGMHAEGGIVFYIDESGEHGLVAAMEDIEDTYEWGCYGEDIEGADSIGIGTGLQNTLDIVNYGCTSQNGDITLAQVVLAYESEGYSDWYAPSIDELKEMYYSIGLGSQVGNIGGFETSVFPTPPEESFYWSSSEHYTVYAWAVSFMTNGGNPYTDSKNTSNRVRPIRSF